MRLEHEFVFESYGVRVRIEASDSGLLADAERRARKALVGRLQLVDTGDADHSFGISSDKNGVLHLYQNGQRISYDDDRRRFFKFFDSLLRIAVAERAVDWVFIHAGVVGWKGKAIVVPGNSFCGKTTLVQELVKAGAEYFSDEYAVFDAEGLVHPFPRDLSVRYMNMGSLDEQELSVASFGGITASQPIRVGMVLLTEYADGAVWEPIRLSTGKGILEMIPHTLPRVRNTAHSLKVLNTAVSDAIILKSLRGDAKSLIPIILSFF